MNLMLAPPPSQTTIANDALYEIVDGEIVELPPTPMLSGKVSLRIAAEILKWTDLNPGIGTATHEDIYRMPVSGNTRRPDAAFISAATFPVQKSNEPKGDYPLAPDLAVEVASWHDELNVFEDKIEEYFENGVREVWSVYPKLRQVRVFNGSKIIRIFKGVDVLKSDILPGFEVAVDSLFPKPVPKA